MTKIIKPEIVASMFEVNVSNKMFTFYSKHGRSYERFHLYAVMVKIIKPLQVCFLGLKLT